MTTTRPEGPYRSSRLYGNSREVVTVTYEGQATITRPAHEQPWAWTETHESCGHKHPNKPAADLCGQHLGLRLARQANKEWRKIVAPLACHLATGTGDRVYEDQPGYIRCCTVHDTADSTFHKTPEAAEAGYWHCPWAR